MFPEAWTPGSRLNCLSEADANHRSCCPICNGPHFVWRFYSWFSHRTQKLRSCGEIKVAVPHTLLGQFTLVVLIAALLFGFKSSRSPTRNRSPHFFENTPLRGLTAPGPVWRSRPQPAGTQSLPLDARTLAGGAGVHGRGLGVAF